MFFKKINGQSTLEYVVMIAVVVGALLFIGIYVHRAMQGKLHDSADQIGEQYEAGTTKSFYRISYNQDQTETQLSSGHIDTTVRNNSQTKSGSENLTASASKY